LNWECILRQDGFGATWVKPTDRSYHIGCVKQILSYSITSNGLAVEEIPRGKVKGEQRKLGVAPFPGLVQKEDGRVTVLRVVGWDCGGSTNAGINAELDIE
jgi:hypothetical protein